MKLKEKLADDYANLQGPAEEYDTAMLAYIAGFDTAIERLVSQFDWVEAGNQVEAMMAVGEEET